MKPKPCWLFFTGRDTWVTIAPTIYYPRSVSDPKHYPEVIVHESVHLQRQEAVGLTRWLLKYIFSRRFRFDEEILAIRAQLHVLPVAYRLEAIQSFAKQLSGFQYFWAASEKDVIAALGDCL